jgi:hypothetical protein
LGLPDASFACGEASGASLMPGLVVLAAERSAGQPFTASACEEGSAAGTSGSGVVATGSGLGIGACGPAAGAGDPWPVPLVWGPACCAAWSASPKLDGAGEAEPDEDKTGATPVDAEAADNGFSMIDLPDDKRIPGLGPVSSR